MSAPLPEFARLAPDVQLGARVRLNSFINLYGCTIGDDTMIGTFVEIQRDVVVGPRCRIQSHTFGTCIACGEGIGKARLQAFPRATHCVTCKQREERR